MVISLDELWNVYRKEKDGEVKERLLMIIWLEEGASSYDVARRLNCPHSKALYWKKRFRKMGIVGLRTKPRSGRPSDISKERELVIKEQLGGKNFWQTKWVSELIYEKTGVKYSQRHIVRLMHKWGFKLITPRKQHLKSASKEEKEEFVKKTKNFWVPCLKDGM